MRHDELTAQLKPFGGSFRILGSGTGLHLVLEALPETIGEICSVYGLKSKEPGQIEQILRERALEAGVSLYCLSDFRIPYDDKMIPSGGIPDRADGNPFNKDGSPCEKGSAGMEDPGFRRPALLLGFGALDEEKIREGIRRLSRSLVIRIRFSRGVMKSMSFPLIKKGRYSKRRGRKSSCSWAA